MPNHKILSLAALRKVQELVEKGITVIGEKPTSTASLVGGMDAEKERELIINLIWDKISNKTAKEVLKEKGILPDCEITATDKSSKFDYIHRQAAGVDFYFISNQNKQAQTISAAFRISGKQPEFWDAVTGEIRPITDFYEANGQTFIQLSFNPNGSAFVVFRKPISVKTQKSEFQPIKTYETIQAINTEWEVSFDPKWGGSTIKMDKLISWTEMPNDGIKYYSGKAVYRTKFNFTGAKKQLYLEIDDIKDVGVAKIKLNGKDLGIVWCPPFRVLVDGVLKNGNNDLEIEVVNSWRNRLVGDKGKPQNERFTKTNITIKPEWQLLPSGIIGEVKIIKER